MSETVAEIPEPVPAEIVASETADVRVPAEAMIESDLLVEDVSIDGMCGVY
jgi:mycofactocin precursor